MQISSPLLVLLSERKTHTISKESFTHLNAVLDSAVGGEGAEVLKPAVSNADFFNRAHLIYITVYTRHLSCGVHFVQMQS
jgi:hypothetical protein